MRDFESCMQSVTRSGRRPGNEAIGTRVIYFENEEAPASSASMLGTPMQIQVHKAYFMQLWMEFQLHEL